MSAVDPQLQKKWLNDANALLKGVMTPDPKPPEATAAVYVVTAYRWGQRNAHSYVVAAVHDLEQAKRIAEQHVEYRGGKYAAEVCMAVAWSEDDEALGKSSSEQVYYVESPYFGRCGDAGHFHPADVKKPGVPHSGWKTNRELANRVYELERELTRERTAREQAEAIVAEQAEIISGYVGTADALYKAEAEARRLRELVNAIRIHNLDPFDCCPVDRALEKLIKNYANTPAALAQPLPAKHERPIQNPVEVVTAEAVYGGIDYCPKCRGYHAFPMCESSTPGDEQFWGGAEL